MTSGASRTTASTCWVSSVNDAITLLGGLDYQNYNGEDEVFLIAQQTEDVVAPFAQVRWDSTC